MPTIQVRQTSASFIRRLYAGTRPDDLAAGVCEPAQPGDCGELAIKRQTAKNYWNTYASIASTPLSMAS